jgi:hypothetical protein
MTAMRPLTHQLFSLMREVQIRPHRFATPEFASGFLTALGWVVLTEEMQQPIGAVAEIANRLIAQATADVDRSPAHLALLCDECIEPTHSASYEALSRHTALFIQSLEALIGGRGDAETQQE